MNDSIFELITVARGEKPADLIFRGGRVVNVFTGEIETADIAVAGGCIAGVGDYSEAAEIIDLDGRYVLPGLINGHVHVESSNLDIGQYARAVVPHGTLGVVTDLHEIANVSGLDGINYVLNRARRLPFDLFLMAPSCVPATHLETSGAALDAAAIRGLLRRPDCIGLGEMMNYPGILFGDPEVLAKVAAAQGKAVDGHSPGLRGRDLNGYLAAGIYSDHECVYLDEAREKLARGMYIMIREGSSEKNLEALLPLVTDQTSHRCCFVVDDRSAHDILNDGDIDAVVRKAIRLGLEPVRAIRMATINTATYFRLSRLGAVAPGYYANLIVSGDLSTLDIGEVYYRGKAVGRGGKPLFKASRATPALRDTVNIRDFAPEALQIPAAQAGRPVIEVVPGQIITRKVTVRNKVEDGQVVADTSRDILKLAVVERHRASGNIGLGMIKGFGLRRGALASSVAHDSHNIVVVGVTDADMRRAVAEIKRLGGGLAAVADGEVLASLPLPVAGLLSDRPLEEVAAGSEAVEQAALNLGCELPAPFAALSFMALPVIPELRLTDRGLVDVGEFRLVD
jgi:adenine deaminase